MRREGGVRWACGPLWWSRRVVGVHEELSVHPRRVAVRASAQARAVLDILCLVTIGAVRLIVAALKTGWPSWVVRVLAVRGLMLLKILLPVLVMRHLGG